MLMFPSLATTHGVVQESLSYDTPARIGDEMWENKKLAQQSVVLSAIPIASNMH